jgi:hypothetical protein
VSGASFSGAPSSFFSFSAALTLLAMDKSPAGPRPRLD